MFYEISRAVRGWWNMTFRRNEIDKTLKTMELTHENGEYHARASYESSPAFAIFAQEMGKWLDAHNAPNWLESRIFDPVNMKSYVITVQRYERPSPTQVISYLRPIVEAAAAVGDESAIKALKRCGYINSDTTP